VNGANDLMVSDITSRQYRTDRYDDYTSDQIIAELRMVPYLKRNTMTTLIARREIGGLLVAACKLVNNMNDQIALFRQILDIDYVEARRHMKLWLYWPEIAAMLAERERTASRDVPFRVPGYRRLLDELRMNT
jgi:hypothetical protein